MFTVFTEMKSVMEVDLMCCMHSCILRVLA